MNIKIAIFILFCINSNILSTKLEYPASAIESLSQVPLDPSKRTSSYPFISGDTFRCFCDFIIDETKIPFDPNKIKDGDTIFVLHENKFLNFFFQNIHPIISAKYILVTHSSLCLEGVNQYAKYLEDENIAAWFGKNLTINHQKASPLPIGLANNYWPHGNTKIISEIVSETPLKKNILLYMNFFIGYANDKRGKIRTKVYRLFSNKKFCHKTKSKDFKSYLYDLRRSKFILSPEGMGIDCHRTWESMLCGSIPIITSSKLNSLFEDLPVLIINDWKIITQEYLIKKYKKISSQKYNLEKLFADYWLNKISDVKNKLKNKITKKIKPPSNFFVDFHKNMSRSKNYKKSVAEKDTNWKKLKSIFDKHIINNISYSETPRIPKIIHQIWLGGNGKLPKKYWRLQKSWIDNHPDWEYKLWTEKEIAEFGLTRKDLYDEADNYGSKSDIARYEILYRIGGLYVDTDFECIKPFDFLNHICDFYAGIVYDSKAVINNALIGTSPRNPILKACVEEMKNKKPGKENANDLMHRTGPWHITKCFFKSIDKCSGPCIAFPVGYFYPWPGYFRNQNSPEQVKKWINPETFANHHWYVAWNK